MRKVWTGLALLTLPLAFVFACHLSPSLVDTWYLPALWPRIQSLLAWPARALPLLPACLAALFLGGILLLPLFGLMSKSRRFLRPFFALSLSAFWLLYAGFMFLWAPLYARTPLQASLKLKTAATSGQALPSLAQNLLRRAQSLRKGLPEDANGVVKLPYSREEALAKADLALKQLEKNHPWVGRHLTAPTPMPRPMLWGKLGISGFFSPWTQTSLVNLYDMDYAVAFTASHELAHQMGWAREDEANFIGFMACLEGDVHFQYAGILTALKHTLDRMHEESPAAWGAFVAAIEGGVYRDLKGSRAIDAKPPSGGVLSAWHLQANDLFLRLNGQPSGVHSYGMFIDLLIAWNQSHPEGEGLITCPAALFEFAA